MLFRNTRTELSKFCSPSMCHLVLLFLIVVCTYSQSLSNGFVGDDFTVIVHNKFYETLGNLPDLFSKKYLITENSQYQSTEEKYSSGSVAYRPVLSFTFFIDHYFWGKNPRGFHLTNLILHLMNCALVYFIIGQLFQNTVLSFITAAIFAVHPINVEAVNNIGYRADVLSSFFSLLGIYYFLDFMKKRYFRKCLIVFICYFLAIFTKESALILPLLMLLLAFRFESGNLSRREMMIFIVGFVLISVFYFYIYLFVFPNTTFSSLTMLGPNVASHIAQLWWNFLIYIQWFFLPVTIKIIPPFYLPDLNPFLIFKVTLSVLIFISFVYLMFCLKREHRVIALGAGWFLISYLPISNLIPIANPIAQRFLYFPGIGLALICGCVLTQIFLINSRIWMRYLLVGFVCIFLMMLSNNYLNVWLNNTTVATALIKYYPNHTKGYILLGIENFNKKEYGKAKDVLLHAAALNTKDARVYSMIGIGSTDNVKFAESYFQRGIMLSPNDVLPLIGLGRLYVLNKQYQKAVPVLGKSIILHPTYSSYVYLMQALIQLKRFDEADNLLANAGSNLTDKDQMETLKNFIIWKNRLKEPVDIGL